MHPLNRTGKILSIIGIGLLLLAFVFIILMVAVPAKEGTDPQTGAIVVFLWICGDLLLIISIFFLRFHARKWISRSIKILSVFELILTGCQIFFFILWVLFESGLLIIAPRILQCLIMAVILFLHHKNCKLLQVTEPLEETNTPQYNPATSPVRINHHLGIILGFIGLVILTVRLIPDLIFPVYYPVEAISSTANLALQAEMELRSLWECISLSYIGIICIIINSKAWRTHRTGTLMRMSLFSPLLGILALTIDLITTSTLSMAIAELLCAAVFIPTLIIASADIRRVEKAYKETVMEKSAEDE